MQRLTAQQLWLLVGLTLVWGINWPIMKLGVGSGFPPLTFRALSMWIGIPVLAMGLMTLKVPFVIPRGDANQAYKHWRELLLLAVFNMFIWHGCIILAVTLLSSGRAAILGYTMPIFSAILGATVYGDKLSARGWLGVGSAASGVLLLLSHEFGKLSGAPMGVLLALIAASTWALGTQLLRRTSIPVATLSISFWMTVLTAIVMSLLAVVFEQARWRMPSGVELASILFNAVLIFGFAHATWFYLARSLPPIASTLSVMMIPILGVFSGAVWLGEKLFWQDWAAVALMVVAIGSVLWPKKMAAAE
ncbi:EamA family transporter [Variovorax sp. PCZ-1]|uniref:DMT family transporter n=1 Tax=Variovorax sp. PCZ-1 TaxID=2835533 RepID=UPI001BCEF441|nr:EamA family transporter [Variovorax sp. PCZ-1]MBS7806639.1 EamA family transporter [Variovorax sp. PCZ-1]